MQQPADQGFRHQVPPRVARPSLSHTHLAPPLPHTHGAAAGCNSALSSPTCLCLGLVTVVQQQGLQQPPTH